MPRGGGANAQGHRERAYTHDLEILILISSWLQLHFRQAVVTISLVILHQLRQVVTLSPEEGSGSILAPYYLLVV